LGARASRHASALPRWLTVAPALRRDCASWTRQTTPKALPDARRSLTAPRAELGSHARAPGHSWATRLATVPGRRAAAPRCHTGRGHGRAQASRTQPRRAPRRRGRKERGAGRRRERKGEGSPRRQTERQARTPATTRARATGCTGRAGGWAQFFSHFLRVVGEAQARGTVGEESGGFVLTGGVWGTAGRAECGRGWARASVLAATAGQARARVARAHWAGVGRARAGRRGGSQLGREGVLARGGVGCMAGGAAGPGWGAREQAG
jgi:hypothetical protein